jgi:hypothetical protein
MNTYTWKITVMATMPSPPAPINEYLVLANYTVTGTDGINTVKFQSQAQFTFEQTQNADGTPFYTPYADLTEEQVIGWIQSEQNLVVNVEANLDAQLYGINNPPIVPEITPLPWVTK